MNNCLTIKGRFHHNLSFEKIGNGYGWFHFYCHRGVSRLGLFSRKMVKNLDVARWGRTILDFPEEGDQFRPG